VIQRAYRASVLGVAGLAPVERLVRRHGWRFGARRFVAGEDVTSAVTALRALRAAGREAVVDVLGEYVTEVAQARAMADEVVTTIEALHAAGLPPVMSVKPTQLGLGLDVELAGCLAERVATRAEALGGRITLDMEDARYTDATLALLRRLWGAGFPRTSTVLQAYLHRSPDDLEAMLADAPSGGPLELRVVKGAYVERPQVALHDMPRIREAFTALCERAWRAGARVAVATHDAGLLRELAAFARGAELPPERVEYQLLYGVRPRLQAELVRAGRPLRVYVPVGKDWYGYFSRRLAERPANLALVLRGFTG
jgi:proline dehydrogenase